MALNIVFAAFILLGFLGAAYQFFFMGNDEAWKQLTQATFDSAETGFTISLGLTGAMALWLGIMRIGEQGGVIEKFARLMSPFFTRIFPGIPAAHPAYGHIVMNFSANMLGLDNAATPIGLKAMRSLQDLNESEEKASNAQIMFLVLNTSGLTLIPVSVLVYRAQMGAEDPSDVFIPILLATFFSTVAGLVAVSLYQQIYLLNKYVLAYLGAVSALIAFIIWYFGQLPDAEVDRQSSIAANFILMAIVILFISMGLLRRVNVYEAFIEGAKDGFQTAIKIIPYLIAILVAIGIFRAGGMMEVLMSGVGAGFAALGLPTDFVPALPTALMKPLSGSGARGLMVDAMEQYGPDSFVGHLVGCLQGSTDTTFYVLAVYFGSVGIKDSRHALVCGLIADFSGIIAAILLGYLFFA